jgi:GNAT superfamily N-acetyltransferase
MSVRIERLERRHRALLGDFQNQHVELVDYLKRFALRHTEKDMLARTYLAIDEGAGAPQLAGYFSLATVSVDRERPSGVPALDRLPGFPIPGVLLARLAVDSRVQGQGLGGHLFEQALGLTLELQRIGAAGFRLFVTDAKDESAARFYERYGFSRLSAVHPCRMVLDLRRLVSDAGAR